MTTRLQRARRLARDEGSYSELLALVPFARFLGIELDGEGSGVTARLPFRAELVGNRQANALHGGVTAAFMENAALLELMLRLDLDRVPKSIDFSIDYLLSGRAEDAYARCEISRVGSRVAHAVVRCWQQQESMPIAVARAHFLLAALE
ncbi:MAG: PaaI family thioesterase [Nevskiales bacterium]|nr:PaaI family thioesterase [Nevskiales bacterium]